MQLTMDTPVNVRTEAGAAVARIVVVSADAHRGEELAQAVRSAGGAWNVVAVLGGPQKAVAALGHSDPDVMVLDAAHDAVASLAQLEHVSQIYPGTQIVLLSDDHSPEALRAAMRIGVREVLPATIDTPSLLFAVRSVLDRRRADAPHEGRVVAFIPCKGGGGATFIATNVAYALAESGQRVILVDLDLQWGNAELFISDKNPTTTLASLASQIERVDSVFLSSSLVQVHPNLGILAAPEDAVNALDIRPEHIDVVLRLARAHYDVVVIDAGPSLDAVTVRALDYADLVLPVLQLNLPAVRDMRRLLKAFRALGYPTDKVKPIVNRYEKGGPVRLEDLEHAMGLPVFKTMPNDFGLASSSINQGIPIIKLAKHSGVAHAIRDLAGVFVTTEAESSRSWLSRMLRRA
jgi:pilus assembly protein CpaE